MNWIRRLVIGQYPSAFKNFQTRITIGVLLALLFSSACRPKRPPKSTPQMGAEGQFWVRVLLARDANSCFFNTCSPFLVKQGYLKTYLYGFGKPEAGTQITISKGTITIAGKPFSSERITIEPDEPCIFNLDGYDYRGMLELIVRPDGLGFDAVNLVPLEPYLAGVVGAEMPDYWEPEALKAQAIAARTYCMYIKKRFGAGRNWDVRKTAANQVYLGVAIESPLIWQIIDETWGEVLTCPKGREKLFPAYYSSVCGGHTEDRRNVFGGGDEADCNRAETLAGVRCPYCKDVVRPKFFFWPDVYIDKKTISQRLIQSYPSLKRLGEIVNIVVAEQSDYEQFSRLTQIRIVGSNGKSDSLRAEDFRLAIDPSGKSLKSTVFQLKDLGDTWAFLQGRGCGHGAGMCQCGAQAMARKGKTAKQILSYYYPGSKIVSLY
ncbi:MAG: SpoIID/LytB domain-containing protein [Sedimentisphaerales bacterium]|nr:SpoIID/LytB domain-containing protein [Sedimentisphaerales bacterium]